jgi:hypothetical protein
VFGFSFGAMKENSWIWFQVFGVLKLLGIWFQLLEGKLLGVRFQFFREQ